MSTVLSPLPVTVGRRRGRKGAAINARVKARDDPKGIGLDPRIDRGNLARKRQRPTVSGRGRRVALILIGAIMTCWSEAKPR